MRINKIGLFVLCFVVFLSACHSDNQKNDYRLFDAFLSGEISAYNEDMAISVDDIFIFEDEENKYCFFDVNSDGAEELVLVSPRWLFILEKADNALKVLYEGTNYEVLLDNGCLLYERHGGAPTHIDYAYIWLTGEGGRVDFSEYDSDGDGEYRENDFYFFDNKQTTKEEFERMTNGFFLIKSEKVSWNVYK